MTVSHYWALEVLYALDTATGEPRWTYDVHGEILGAANVYTGAKPDDAWTARLEAWRAAPPVADGGVFMRHEMLAVPGTGTNGNIGVALDANTVTGSTSNWANHPPGTRAVHLRKPRRACRSSLI